MNFEDEQLKTFLKSKTGQIAVGIFTGLAILKLFQYGYQFGIYLGDKFFQ